MKLLHFVIIFSLAFNLPLQGSEKLLKFKGDQAYKDGFYQNAWDFYSQAYSKSPSSSKPALLKRLAAAALNADKTKEANNIFITYFKALKKESLELSLLAEIHLNHCNLQLSLQAYSAAAQSCKIILKQADKLPEATLKQALDFAVYSLSKAEQLEEASKLIEKYLKSFANIERAELQNARLKILLGQNINALAILDKYKESKLELPGFLRLWAYLKAGEIKRSMEIFSQKIILLKEVPDPACTGVLIKLTEAIYKEDVKAISIILDKAYELEVNIDKKAYIILKKAELLISTQQRKEALKALHFFEEKYPKSNKKFWVIAELAKLYSSQEKPESIKKSIDYLTVVIDAKQSNLQLLYQSLLNRGKSRIKTKTLDEATKDFSKAAEVAASAKMNIDEVAYAVYMAGLTQYFTGRNELDDNAYIQAANYFQKVIEFNASFTENAFIMQAASLRQAQKWDRAIDCLEAMLTRYPKNNEASYLLGLSLLDAGKVTRGLEVMKGFIKNNPQDKRAPLAIIESLRAAVYGLNKQRSMTESLKLIKQFKEQQKNSGDSYREIAPVILHLNAILLWKQNKGQEAELEWVLFLNLYPEHFLAMEVRLWLAFKKMRQTPRDSQSAINFYQEALKLHSKSNLYGFALNQFSQALYSQNQYDEALKNIAAAIEFYRSQLKEDGASRTLASALFFQGEILSAKGDYEFAIKSFSEAQKFSTDKETEMALLGRVGDCYYSMARKYTDAPEKQSDLKLLMNSAIKSYQTIKDSENIGYFIKEQALYKLAKCYETIGLQGDKSARNTQLEKALLYYWELFYSYDDKKKKGLPSSQYYFCRTGYDLARLQLMFDIPDINSAKNTYESLAKSRLPGTQEAAILARQLNQVIQREK